MKLEAAYDKLIDARDKGASEEQLADFEIQLIRKLSEALPAEKSVMTKSHMEAILILHRAGKKATAISSVTGCTQFSINKIIRDEVTKAKYKKFEEHEKEFEEFLEAKQNEHS